MSADLTGLSCKGCSDGIRIADASGQPLRTLTNPDSCTFDDSPTWSPDAATILYSEETCDTTGELFTIPASGGTPHDLGIAGAQPAWGPSKIAYVGSNPSDVGLWTANPDGSDRVEVTPRGTHPAWSSDGRLAFLSGSTLYVAGQSPVTLPFAQVLSLAWSPDGAHFVLTARRKQDIVPDVYIVDSDGTNPVRLTTNYDVFGASWR